jgi:hypothetical protein
MKKLALVLFLVACKPASGPIVDAESGVVDAAVSTVNDVCSLLEVVDSSGVLRTICATVEEIASIIAFILTLRSADAGAAQCTTTLPGTSFCATKDEVAKGIAYVLRLRQARLLVDGGAR